MQIILSVLSSLNTSNVFYTFDCEPFLIETKCLERKIHSLPAAARNNWPLNNNFPFQCCFLCKLHTTLFQFEAQFSHRRHFAVGQAKTFANDGMHDTKTVNLILSFFKLFFFNWKNKKLNTVWIFHNCCQQRIKRRSKQQTFSMFHYRNKRCNCQIRLSDWSGAAGGIHYKWMNVSSKE